MTDYRNERHIPKSYQEVARDDETGAVVYAGGTPERLCAMGFSGKRCKPDWHYTFRSPDKLADHARKHLENCRKRLVRIAERRATRKNAGRGLVVGDLLRASWGYDQTNIDYYEVTALIGSTMVEVRAIGAESYDTGWLCGQCVPMKGKYIGEPTRHVAKDGCVTIDDVRRAYKMTPKTSTAGVPVYGSSYWSSYA